MCRSCGLRHNSVTDTSPGGPGGRDGSLDSVSSAGLAHGGWRSGVSSGDGGCGVGGMAGVLGGGGSGGTRTAGLTMKEYDQHLARLNKENFALKLRVYFLEEKQGQAGQAAPQLYKTNIELKVENETLKRQLFDKQQLLSQASSALSQLEDDYKDQLNGLLQDHETRVQEMQDTIVQLQKTADDYATRCQELKATLRDHQQLIASSRARHPAAMSELSQLCDLAFPTSEGGTAAGGVGGPLSSAGGFQGGENEGCWNNTALWNTAEATAACAAPTSIWSTNTSTASLWGDCASIMQMSADINSKMAGEEPRASSGEPRTNSRSSIDSGKDEEELHRKMSSDSQNSQNGSYCGGESAPNPVHFTSANVTNNNINNTLPSSSNNLQQLQYQQQQHPTPYRSQDNTPASSLTTSSQPQHFHHHHHHNQEGGHLISNTSPNVVVVNAGGHDVGSPSTSHGDCGRRMPSEERASHQHVREGQAAVAGVTSPPSLSGVSGQCCNSSSRVPQLKEELSALQLRMQQLELQLLDKQRHSQALQEDLNNLRKELAEKESEVLDREEKVESLSQELETRHRQLQNREDTIHTLHSDLNRVEPEISVKVQEIVERDRIIEEKIEQLEQQNKILVEIQITLDEKQKQIAELESNLAEARERVTALERDFDKSCGAINGFIADLSTKDKEIATLKKEAKRRDRKIADLVAELKETLDMLGKAKWEAETGGCGEDSVKEMVEEENERLWAEMERKKLELQNLRAEMNKAAEKAEQENSSLSDQLSSCQETLRLKEDAEQRWKEEMAELVDALRTREAVMQKQRGDTEALKVELEGVRLELQEKKMELDNALKSTAVIRDEITLPSNSTVEDQQRQLDVLRHQLKTCREDCVREVQVLKGQLELKNSDILHLQSTILNAQRQIESKSCGGSSSCAAAVAVVGDTNVATNRVEITDNRSSPHASSSETAVGMRYEPLQVSITAGLLSTNLGQQPTPTEARSGDLGSAAMQSRLVQDGAREQATKADPGGRLTLADEAVDRNTIARIHEQIENLRSELKTTNKAIGHQASVEVTQRNYPQIVKKYRSECSRLRKRLGESNNACELLRNRLEELAEFLEQILDMDERGLIDLSKISGFAKANLYKSLNDSRALSQTLSMSVLAGMDTLLEEGFELDEINLEMLEEDTGKSFMPEDSLYQHCDATNMTLASSVMDDSRVSSLAWDSLLPDLSNVNNDALKATNYQQLAKNVCQDVEAKAKKLDDILMQMANLSGNLDRKEMNAFNQAHVIKALQDKISKLEDVLDSQKPLHENVRSIVTPEKLETDAGDLVEVACQTLLAMAPRQSVSSLADLSTPYLSSCSESLAQSSANMDPVIEEPPIPVDEFETTVSEAMNALTQKDAATIQPQEPLASSLLSPLSVVVAPRSSVDTVPTFLSAASDGKKATAKTAVIKPGCVSADEAQPLPHRVTASPSESEAWSEPDRNVSLARIGLETCTLAASLDRSLSRSRQTRASAALSSESDTEECLALPEDNALSLLSIAPSASATPLGAPLPKYLPKRKSDASEVRRLTTKLRTLEHLNETLKAELNIYQNLSYQLSPTTDQQQSDHKLSSPSSNNSAIKNNSAACSAAIANNSNASSVAYASINGNNTGSTANGTILTSNAVTSATVTSGASVRVTASSCSSSLPLVSASKKLRRFTTSGEDSLALAAPLLQEIRSLRTKLEESISNNDQLRDQLEAAVLSCSRASDDPSHLTHLTAALLNAQETLQLTREKLAFAQRCEQVQADRCALAERRTEEEAKVCYELRSQLQDTQQQVVTAVAQVEVNEVKWTKHTQDLKEKCEVAEKRLLEAKRMHEESELMLQERLEEVTRACEESELRLKAQHEAIDDVYSSLQETSHWPHLSHLHSALQASETQVLKVTRDRLVLLGEKSKLQAQLMSAQAQTSLLQDSLCEEEVSYPQKPLLHQQLAQVQSAVKNLHEQCARLHATNASITRERDSLQEKLSSYKAFEKLVNKPDITLETVNPSDVARGEKNASETRRLNSVAFQQLQRNHSLLQEDYTHLQQLYNLLQDDEKRACQKLHLTNSALHKAQLNIDGLTEQYQDKMQLLQKDCNDKLIEAERQVNEVQARFQERMKTSEEKLTEVQQRCNETLTQMKRSYSSEVARLEEQLRHLLQQLDSERKLGDDLRTEMQRLKLSATQDLSWSEDNKENLGSTRLHSNLSPRSPLRQSILSTGLSGYNSRSTDDGNSLVSEALGGSLRRLTCGNTRNSGRSLHFSDPNLGPGIAYTTEEDEEDIRGVCNSDSPDLGLGSSDNGQMSSLERVMGHRTPSHTTSNAKAGSLANSENTLGRRGGANDTQHNNQYGYCKQTSLPHLDLSKGSIDEGRRSSLLTYSPSKNGHHPISVLITERSPQSATSAADVFSDPLCSVTSHVSLASSNEQLNREVRTLRERLSNSDARLMEAERQLAAANARKQTVERAICRQLSKTHQVLRRAKGNLQQHSRAGEQESGAAAGVAATERHSSVDKQHS